MKPALLCLLLLSACDFKALRNYRVYALTWTCLSPEGCERAEEMAPINRAQVIDGDHYVEFLGTRGYTLGYSQMVSSDELPAGCYWVHGFAVFGVEVEPFMFCRSSGRIDMELSIPNDDRATHSEWSVAGRETDP